MIYMNGRNADNEIIGSQELQRVYCGDQMIWQRNPISPWDKYEEQYSDKIILVPLDEYGNERNIIWVENSFGEAIYDLWHVPAFVNLYYGDNAPIPSESTWEYYIRQYRDAVRSSPTNDTLVMFRYPRNWIRSGYVYKLASGNSSGDASFHKKLQTVVLPQEFCGTGNVILEYEFLRYTSVRNVVFRSPEAQLSYGCFANCYNLKSIDLPRIHNNEIPVSAFYGCTDITIRLLDNADGSVPNAPWSATNATVIWKD